MRNIWMLTKAKLRKSKGQTLSMLLLITIAAMLLNIGFVLYFGVGNFFDERAAELNTAHYIVILPEHETNNERLEFIQDFPEVIEVEHQDVLFYWGILSSNDNTVGSGNIIISAKTTEQTMNPPSLIGDSLPLTGNAIYIPHFMFLGGGLSIGDDLMFEFMDEVLHFTVAGSTEEIMFGESLMTNVWRVYVSEETFLSLSAEFPSLTHLMISARMTGGWELLSARYRAEFGYDYTMVIWHYGNARAGRTLVPTIAALLIAAFAFILLIVGAIVARFRINNDIEESMVNIGALKAIGYRNHQIILSIVLQFGIVAFIGGIFGALLSQAVLPIVAGILEPMLALVWNPTFDINMMPVALALILLVVLLFASVTSRRINKLHPLIALRGGVTTHSFKKNYLPLDKTRGSLSFLLAVKQLLRNKKQAIMLSIIVGALTFTSVAGITLHYNVNVDMTAFLNTVFGELPDVGMGVYLDDTQAVSNFRERMLENPDVEAIYGFQSTSLVIYGEPITMTIVSDFSYLAGHELVRGRLPILPSEVVLDNVALSTLGKNIGDWVTIGSGDLEQEYIITGVIQIFGGFRGMMSFDGVSRIQPSFVFDNFYVNLIEGACIDTFIETTHATEGDIIIGIMSFQEHVDAAFGAIGDIFAAVNMVIMLVVASVVVLVLYLVVKTTIIRRRRDLGTQKALGFTTLQLMNQIALGLTPTIIIGAVLGIVGGFIGFNSVVALLLRGQGIAQVDFHIPVDWIVMVAVGLILLAYAVSMLIAWRIRKISAYALVSE